MWEDKWRKAGGYEGELYSIERALRMDEEEQGEDIIIYS